MKTNIIEVSVIVSVYNAEKYLQKCLESIVNQTLKNIELIIINNGSTDGSYNIISKFQNEYDFISVINLEKNTGDPSTPWNIGVENSKGEYIGFVDADDWCSVTLFEQLLNFARKKKCKIAFCDCIEVLPNGTENEWRHSSFSHHDLLINPHLPVWAKLYHKSVFEEYSLKFKQQIHCDAGFNMVAYSFVEKVGYLPKPLYYYNRSNPNSETNTKKRLRQADVISTFESIISGCNKKYYDEIIFSVFYNAYLFLAQRYKFFVDYYIDFLHEYRDDIMKNKYFISNTNNASFILKLTDIRLVPKNIIVSNYNEKINESQYLTEYNFLGMDDTFNDEPFIIEARKHEDFAFIETYKMLLTLYNFGGVLLEDNVEVLAPLGEVRVHSCSFSKKGKNTLNGHIIAALPKNDLIKVIIESYLELRGNNFRKAFGYEVEFVENIANDVLKKKYNSSYDEFQESYLEDIWIISPDRSYYGLGEMALFRINNTIKENDIEKINVEVQYLNYVFSKMYNMEEQNENLYKELLAYKNSKSWKIIRPLRVLSHYIKEKLGR